MNPVMKMKNTYLLHSPTARALYADVRSLPIVDYHCHLSPKEIYEDVPFDNNDITWALAFIEQGNDIVMILNDETA